MDVEVSVTLMVVGAAVMVFVPFVLVVEYELVLSAFSQSRSRSDFRFLVASGVLTVAPENTYTVRPLYIVVVVFGTFM